MKAAYKIKRTKSELEQLLAMYEYFVPLVQPDTEYDALVWEHMILLYQRLIQLLATDRKNYTLKLNRAEGRAFVILWNDLDTSDKALIFGHVVVCSCIKEIDQHQVQDTFLFTQNI